MIQRFVNTEEAIRSTIAAMEKDLVMVTKQEWYVRKELTKF